MQGLSGYCEQKGISRAQAIRDAVTELLKEKGVSERNRAFGIWKGKKFKIAIDYASGWRIKNPLQRLTRM